MSSETGAAAGANPTDRQNLGRQGGVVSGMTALSRITGFARDVVLSHFFGATGIADAFFVAFRIPNFFRRMFAEGAFSQAFVPVLASVKVGESATALREFVRATSGTFLLVMFAISLLGVAGAHGLVLVFAPGFAGDVERMTLTGDMLRLTFPYLGFIALTAYAGALLNSYHRYAIPAFTPVLLNLSLISAALMVAPSFSTPVMALAWGVLAAGVIQFLFQLPALRSIDMLVWPQVRVRHTGVRRVARLMVPAMLSASVSQINALIDTILASLLVTGSISWLYYADRLMELPIGLVAIAIATVLLPNLSRLHAAGSTQDFSRALDWGLRMGLLLGVPAAVSLYLLAVPLVATVFYHGAMTAADVAMAALALQAFSIGPVAISLVKISAPAYFSREDTTTPFRIALVAVLVNIVLNLALFRIMGHVGLALATSTAACVQAYLLIRGTLRSGVYRPERTWWKFGGQLVAATVLLVGWLWAVVPDGGLWLDMTLLDRVGHLAVACIGGVVVYFGTLVAAGLRVRDLRYHL
jgi:putative peptidoglycan lipid II flippase